MTVLNDSVKRDGDTWTFTCPGVIGSPCGDFTAKEPTPFVSTGWPTKKVATARGTEHFAEHRGEAPMSTLEAFRLEHSLIVEPTGTVRLEDI